MWTTGTLASSRSCVKVGELFSSSSSFRWLVLKPCSQLSLPPGLMRTNGSITPDPVDWGSICWNTAPFAVPVDPLVVRLTTLTPAVPSGLVHVAAHAWAATIMNAMVAKERFNIACLLVDECDARCHPWRELERAGVR